MATNFWHIIHRLSLLCELKAELQKAEACNNTTKVTVLRTELECASHAIENVLKQWKPSIQSECQPSNSTPVIIESFDYPPATADSASQLLSSPTFESSDWDCDLSSLNNATTNHLTDPNAYILSIANNAEAYRQAALVFLYRNIHMLERSHPKVQTHVHLTLVACVRVVEWAGPMPALLWPLFISSVEAISEEDRNIAIMAFSGTERRQGMLNITRAWEIVEEVWLRGNKGEHLDWRTICEEKGVTLIFG